MPTKKKGEPDPSATPTAPSSSSQSSQSTDNESVKYGWTSLITTFPGLIQSDLSAISKSAQPLARNWLPILEPTKTLIKYMGEQVSKMMDDENPDPSWKNFKAETDSIMAKLESVIAELSKDKVKLTSMLASLHKLLQKLPDLFKHFDKLQLHLNVGHQLFALQGELNAALEEKTDFPDLVLKQLETHIPGYKFYKEELENQYNKLMSLNSHEEFSKLNVIQKMAALSAMEEFNGALETFYLQLNWVSVWYGIKQGYLLDRPVFANKMLSINKLSENFTAFYNNSMIETNVTPPVAEHYFPFQDNLILQQRSMLEEHKKGDALNKDVVKIRNQGIESILFNLDKESKKLNSEKESKKIKKQQEYLQKYLEVFTEYAAIYKDPTIHLSKIHSDTSILCKKLNEKFSLSIDLEQTINTIAQDTDKAIEQARIKSKNKEAYITLRLNYSENARSSSHINTLIDIEIKNSKPKLAEHRYLTQFQQAFALRYEQDHKAKMSDIIENSIEACKAKEPAFYLENGLVNKIKDIPRQLAIKFAEERAAKAALTAKPAQAEVIEIPQTKLARVKAILTDIFQQIKETKAVIDTRPKNSNPDEASTITKIETSLQYVYSQLETMLDKDIYQQFIMMDHTSNKFDAGNGWIKTTGVALEKIVLTVEKYKELAVYTSTRNMPNLSNITAKERMVNFAEKVHQQAVLFKELMISFVALENDPYIKTLFSISGLKQTLFPAALSNIEVTAEHQEAPIAHTEQPTQSAEPLELFFKTATTLFQKTAMKYAQQYDETRIHSIVNTLTTLKNLTSDFQKLKKQQENKINLSKMATFGFLLNHTTDLFQLMQELPAAFNAIHSVSKKEFSVLANNLNVALRELVLLFNRIEIEFNLERGYFTQRSLSGLLSPKLQALLKLDQLPASLAQTSLNDLVMATYSQLEKLNFAVPENQRFPFTDAVIEQQTLLQATAADQTLRKEYINHLLTQSQKQAMINLNSELLASDNKHGSQATRLNALINDNIDKLTNELDANQVILKNLLGKLTQTGSRVETLNSKLFTLSNDDTDRENMYLLYHGQAKKLMVALEQQSAQRKDLLNEIDLSINKLSKKRAQTYYFFAKSRRTHLENTLEAYHQLKQFLAHPGTKVTDFSTEEPYLYKLLVAHDKKLLENLLTLSEQSFYLKDEKLITGDVYPTPEPVIDTTRLLAIKDYQNNQIEDRISELKKHFLFISSTSNKKIKLLTALSEHLKDKSLEKSLAAISKDKTLSQDFYLLHEGRTGKMIKNLSQLYLPRKDIIHEIQLEITHLQHQRHNSFYFSARNKKLLIENRIKACQALADLLHGDENQINITAAVDLLEDKHKKLLLSHETGLLDKLKDWENVNLKVTPAPSRYNQHI